MISSVTHYFIGLKLQLEKQGEELLQVQQSIDDVKSELRKEKEKLAEVQASMASEKMAWVNERTDLLAQIKKVVRINIDPATSEAETIVNIKNCMLYCIKVVKFSLKSNILLPAPFLFGNSCVSTCYQIIAYIRPWPLELWLTTLMS